MNTSSTHLVALVGGSGAGKGWLASRLCSCLGGDAAHLSLDHFYRDRTDLTAAEREALDFDAPAAVDWDDLVGVLGTLRAGRPAEVPRYDFSSHRRSPSPSPLLPRPVVFVEGLWLLQPPAVRAMFDLTLYLDASEEIRISRRLQRDVAERGRSPAEVAARMRRDVLPWHARQVEPQRDWADLVLSQPFAPPEIDLLADALHGLLARPGTTEAAPEAFRTELRATLLTA